MYASFQLKSVVPSTALIVIVRLTGPILVDERKIVTDGKLLLLGFACRIQIRAFRLACNANRMAAVGSKTVRSRVILVFMLA